MVFLLLLQNGNSTQANPENIKLLVDLGLTHNQAKTYLMLVKLEKATAKKISDFSKITRQDIYRVISDLEKMGLVEKILTRPTQYKAATIEKATELLLQEKSKQQEELRKRIKKLIKTSKNDHPTDQQQDPDPNLIIIPAKQILIQKLKEKLQKSQKSLQVVTSKERFSTAIIELVTDYKKALKRGVKIEITTEKHKLQKQTTEILQNLSKNNRFIVKYSNEPPPAIVAIFDIQEAYITMSEKANFNKTSTLWSSNPCFIAVLQNYFECKWNNAQQENTA